MNLNNLQMNTVKMPMQAVSFGQSVKNQRNFAQDSFSPSENNNKNDINNAYKSYASPAFKSLFARRESIIPNYQYVKDGTELPRGVMVYVNPDTELVLGSEFEFDLNDKELKKKLSKLRDGQFLSVGREGDIRTPSEDRLVSRIHLLIGKKDNKIVVEDRSTNGTQIIYRKINENEFVRNVGNDGRPIDKTYLKNSKQVRYFLNQNISSGMYTRRFEDYVRIMQNAHAIAYKGISGKDLWYKKHDRLLIMDPYQIRGDSDSLYSNYREKSRKVERIAEILNDSYRTDNEDVTQVYLDGISLHGLPKNRETYHIYPKGIYMEEYFRQMYRTSCEAISLINSNAPKSQILNKIAEHYQYAVNARPFYQINNSLFMNEVNTLLNRAGLHSMPHNILDHAAQRLQSGSFKKYFSDLYECTKLE